MKNRRRTGQMFFSMMKNPRFTGTVAPSSKYLAQAMAVQAKGVDEIVELGAGTGAITRVLLKNYPSVRMVLVEYQSQLADELCSSFPELEVKKDTAKAVLDTLVAGDEKRALVSSLPFRSLPKQVHDETVKSVLDLLKRSPQTKLIQFTYGHAAPFDLPTECVDSYTWYLVNKVWRNLPPAKVWELVYKPMSSNNTNKSTRFIR